MCTHTLSNRLLETKAVTDRQLESAELKAQLNCSRGVTTGLWDLITVEIIAIKGPLSPVGEQNKRSAAMKSELYYHPYISDKAT